MTAQEAFCAAVARGMVPTKSITADHVRRFIAAGWWDDKCEAALLATEVLTELGRPRTQLEYAKCLVADGYTLHQASSLAFELTHFGWSFQEQARDWVLQQMGAAAA